MALIRNAALALLATALLIGGLVVLFPTPAEAAQVHLTSAGITPPTSASGNPFDVKFTVKIPAGEHIPADFAKVLVASSSATLGAGGTLNAPYICDARTSGSPGAATAAIISISGAAAASTSYFGYGYEVTASGSGYSFANPTVVFNSGSGSGYGGGTAGEKTITVTVRVSNCAITYTSGQATVKMQAFIGSSTTQLRSFPVTVTLFDPAAPAPTNPTTSNGDIVITVTQSSSGGLTSTDILIDTSGGFDGVAGHTAGRLRFQRDHPGHEGRHDPARRQPPCPDLQLSSHRRHAQPHPATVQHPDGGPVGPDGQDAGAVLPGQALRARLG
jgi:hypothetical protein